MAEGIATVTDRHARLRAALLALHGEDGAAAASFELRIPADGLQPALRDLAKLGEVRSRSRDGPGRDRARSWPRRTACRPPAPSAAACCAACERADSDTEAEALRRRLDLNAGEIRGLRGQVRELRTRTDYAAVAVTLTRRAGEDSGGATAATA